ncbi:MAG: hypothetical protein IJS65_08940 [Clostridia bacterium]|nr:hypothetical protein [Clostridia bacterium]
MKKILLIALSLSLCMLFGCGKKGKPEKTEPEKEPEIVRTVTFINRVENTDVWILPQTKENLDTTLWGKATAGKVAKDEERAVGLTAPGDGDKYIFRMIDEDEMYYEANGLILPDGCRVEIKHGEDGPMSYIITVTDENGENAVTYDVFAAHL